MKESTVSVYLVLQNVPSISWKEQFPAYIFAFFIDGGN